MWRITVSAYKVALAWKSGKLVNVLTAGKYWVGFSTVLRYYNTAEPLMDQSIMPYLMDYENIDAYIDIKSIADTEIGIETKEGLYQRILTAGKVGYWKSLVRYDLEIISKEELALPESISKVLLTKPEFARQISSFHVEAYQVGLLYIDGVFEGQKQAGQYHYWKTNQLVTIRMVDTRLQTAEVSGQEILTKDRARVRINFHAQYKVIDVDKAIMDAVDYYKQLYAALQMILRAYIGTMTLDQLLSNKEKIGPYVIEQIRDAAAVLGVQVIAGGIKDVILPGEVKDIMNQVLIAQKKAQANTIMRQEETASTRSLLNTAKLMEDNKMLLKLKEMEYMEKIADKVGEITINGGSQIMDQLSTLLVSEK